MQTKDIFISDESIAIEFIKSFKYPFEVFIYIFLVVNMLFFVFI